MRDGGAQGGGLLSGATDEASARRTAASSLGRTDGPRSHALFNSPATCNCSTVCFPPSRFNSAKITRSRTATMSGNPGSERRLSKVWYVHQPFDFAIPMTVACHWASETVERVAQARGGAPGPVRLNSSCLDPDPGNGAAGPAARRSQRRHVVPSRLPDDLADPDRVVLPEARAGPERTRRWDVHRRRRLTGPQHDTRRGDTGRDPSLP